MTSVTASVLRPSVGAAVGEDGSGVRRDGRAEQTILWNLLHFARTENDHVEQPQATPSPTPNPTQHSPTPPSLPPSTDTAAPHRAAVEGRAGASECASAVVASTQPEVPAVSSCVPPAAVAAAAAMLGEPVGSTGASQGTVHRSDGPALVVSTPPAVLTPEASPRTAGTPDGSGRGGAGGRRHESGSVRTIHLGRSSAAPDAPHIHNHTPHSTRPANPTPNPSSMGAAAAAYLNGSSAPTSLLPRISTWAAATRPHNSSHNHIDLPQSDEHGRSPGPALLPAIPRSSSLNAAVKPSRQQNHAPAAAAAASHRPPLVPPRPVVMATLVGSSTGPQPAPLARAASLSIPHPASSSGARRPTAAVSAAPCDQQALPHSASLPVPSPPLSDVTTPDDADTFASHLRRTPDRIPVEPHAPRLVPQDRVPLASLPSSRTSSFTGLPAPAVRQSGMFAGFHLVSASFGERNHQQQRDDTPRHSSYAHRQLLDPYTAVPRMAAPANPSPTHSRAASPGPTHPHTAASQAPLQAHARGPGAHDVPAVHAAHTSSLLHVLLAPRVAPEPYPAAPVSSPPAHPNVLNTDADAALVAGHAHGTAGAVASSGRVLDWVHNHASAACAAHQHC